MCSQTSGCISLVICSLKWTTVISWFSLWRVISAPSLAAMGNSVARIVNHRRKQHYRNTILIDTAVHIIACRLLSVSRELATRCIFVSMFPLSAYPHTCYAWDVCPLHEARLLVARHHCLKGNNDFMLYALCIMLWLAAIVNNNETTKCYCEIKNAQVFLITAKFPP